MNSPQARRPLRLKAALLALSLAGMTTQVGGAATAPATGGPLAAQASVAALPMPGERELLAWLVRVLRLPPVSGSWALFVAGLTGAWTIGHRRSGFANRALDLHRLRQ